MPDEECGGETVSSTPIILHKEKSGPKGRFQGITFNGKFRGWGRWFYLYDEGSDKAYMFLEFAAGSGYPRRHAFSQLDDDVFELIRAVYYNEDIYDGDTTPRITPSDAMLAELQNEHPDVMASLARITEAASGSISTEIDDLIRSHRENPLPTFE